jgi:hypothetical protein
MDLAYQVSAGTAGVQAKQAAVQFVSMDSSALSTRTVVQRVSRESATLAQLVERLIRNQQVAGSIPAGGSRTHS